MEERMVIDPETGAEYPAFQGDPESANAALAELAGIRKILQRSGKPVPGHWVDKWLGNVMPCDWHDCAIDTICDVYGGSDDGAREHIMDLIHDTDSFPTAPMGNDTATGRAILDATRRDMFAGAVPLWKAREIILVDEFRRMSRRYDNLIAHYVPGDDEEEDAFCQALAYLSQSRL